MHGKVPYEDDWRKEAPFLSQLQGDLKAEVPEGYFERLPEEVLGKLASMESGTSGSIAEAEAIRFWNWKKWSMVAGLALVIGTGLFKLGWELSEEAPLPAAAAVSAQLETLSEAEIMAALDWEDLDEAELAAMMGDEALAGVDMMEYEQEANEFLADELDWRDLEALELENLEDL